MMTCASHALALRALALRALALVLMVDVPGLMSLLFNLSCKQHKL